MPATAMLTERELEHPVAAEPRIRIRPGVPRQQRAPRQQYQEPDRA